jgi:hypothetical protein
MNQLLPWTENIYVGGANSVLTGKVNLVQIGAKFAIEDFSTLKDIFSTLDFNTKRWVVR